MNAYSVNHMTRSIILTGKFAKAASTPDTKEYRILIKLRTDNPGYDIIKRTITKKEGKRYFWFSLNVFFVAGEPAIVYLLPVYFFNYLFLSIIHNAGFTFS